MTALVVVGAGGFGRETLDVVEAINRAAAAPTYYVLGVVDDAPSDLALARLAARGAAHLGSIAAWLATRPSADYLIGIGDPATRRTLDEALSAAGLRAATAVHPNAVVGSLCSFGEGTVICAGVQVSTNVHLGRHVHVNPNATIGHDAVIEDFVSINPGATISGDCRLESETYVGSSAVILQGLRTGRSSIIGAAACVIRDVQPRLTLVGVPAKAMTR